MSTRTTVAKERWWREATSGGKLPTADREDAQPKEPANIRRQPIELPPMVNVKGDRPPEFGTA